MGKNNISLRLSDYENEIYRLYAEMEGISVSELVRREVNKFVKNQEIFRLLDEGYNRLKTDSGTFVDLDTAIKSLKE